MKLIKISDDTLLNPEFISAIENKYIEGVRIMVIRCDGKDFTTMMSSAEVLQEMMSTDTMTPDPRTFQFWAG